MLEKAMHMFRKPSTTVWIARWIVSFGKKGNAGSDKCDASDKIWLTIETCNKQKEELQPRKFYLKNFNLKVLC